MEEKFFNSGKKVELSIPDDDMAGWIKTLREGNFSQDEIDAILSHLNKPYRDQKFPKEQRIEEELKKIEADLKDKYGKILNDEQKSYLRKSIGTREEFN